MQFSPSNQHGNRHSAPGRWCTDDGLWLTSVGGGASAEVNIASLSAISSADRNIRAEWGYTLPSHAKMFDCRSVGVIPARCAFLGPPALRSQPFSHANTPCATFAPRRNPSTSPLPIWAKLSILIFETATAYPNDCIRVLATFLSVTRLKNGNLSTPNSVLPIANTTSYCEGNGLAFGSGARS